jgi:hypothetical protein
VERRNRSVIHEGKREIEDIYFESENYLFNCVIRRPIDGMTVRESRFQVLATSFSSQCSCLEHIGCRDEGHKLASTNNNNRNVNSLIDNRPFSRTVGRN